MPDDTRKIHGAQIPSLGGVGVFTGYMVAAAFFMHMSPISWNYVIASSVILFFTGIYDDLMNMRPSKKFLAQLIASAVTVYFADIRLPSLYGMGGVGELPYWLSVGLTTVACTFFINVFNFVDGIDGLACVSAILYAGILGLLFAGMGAVGLAGVAFGLAGASAGLLYYNVAPAKIYMGDTGSMFIGFTLFLMSVVMVTQYGATGNVISTYVHSQQGAVIVVLSLLFLPVFDALRVFALRASKGISPIRADRTHLHYYLLDAGLNHTQSVVVIIASNVLIIVLGYFLQDVNPLIAVGGMSGLASVIMWVIYRKRNKASSIK